MIMDRTGLFSDRQAITVTTASTNVVDLGAFGTHPIYGAAKRDAGKGGSVPLTIAVVEAFNNLTSLTITVEVDDNAAFTSPVTVFSSPAYAAADLVPGKRLLLPDTIPVGTNERYLRLKYTLAGTAPTTGRITAGVSMGNQTN